MNAKMSLALVFLLNGLVLLTHGDASTRTIYASDYGARPDGSDTTPAVRAALHALDKTSSGRLVFPPGQYDFYPDRADERYLFASNNDEGLKRIGFAISNRKNLIIDGGGARFVFHGRMVPFLIDHAERLTLQNFSVDFSRPFHSEGRVLAVTPHSVDLDIPEEFPFQIRNGVLVFVDAVRVRKAGDPPEVLYPYETLLAFDPVRRETAFMAPEVRRLESGIAAESIGGRRIRIPLSLRTPPARVGETFVFGADFRDCPGFLIADSASVTLREVTVNHCGGMGVIAQRSADLSLQRVAITPPPGGRRILSITADAIHFVNCRGRITLEDCVFEQQLDDAVNIHGLYAQITRRLAPNQIEIKLVHPQQAGVDFVEVGTRLELTQGRSLAPLGAAIVTRVERVNKQFTIVETSTAIPDSVAVGDCVANADANTAEVHIARCLFRGNRARGILLGSRGRTVVENNTFHIPGAAILFEGDGRFWFEQAGVRDVLIRGNTFDNCNFGIWGHATIEVRPGLDEAFQKVTRYNHNIRIEDNLFRVFGSAYLLSAYSVDGLRFKGNKLEISQDYEGTPAPVDKLFNVRDSDHVELEQPIPAKGNATKVSASQPSRQ